MKTICFSCNKTFNRKSIKNPEICPECAKEDLKKAVDKFLKSLTEREAKVLKVRWGLEKPENDLEKASKAFKALKREQK